MNRSGKREWFKTIRSMNDRQLDQFINDIANDGYKLAHKHVVEVLAVSGIGPKRRKPIMDAWERIASYDGIVLVGGGEP